MLVELVRARNFDTYAKNGSVLLLSYNSQLFVSKFFFFFARSFIQKFSKKSTKFILLRALLLIKFWTSQQKFYCLSGKSVPVLNHSNCAYFFSLYWVAISSSATCIYCFLSPFFSPPPPMSRLKCLQVPSISSHMLAAIGSKQPSFDFAAICQYLYSTEVLKKNHYSHCSFTCALWRGIITFHELIILLLMQHSLWLVLITGCTAEALRTSKRLLTKFVPTYSVFNLSNGRGVERNA